MATDFLKREYLVAYDYGSGAIWSVVAARSPTHIAEKFPELMVYEEKPPWMSKNQYEEIRKSGVVDLEAGNIPDWMRLSNETTKRPEGCANNSSR